MKISIKKFNVVMDCSNAGTLAAFYNKLLGWEWTHPHANGWAAITSPSGIILAFQEVEGYEPPVWPKEADKQGQMLHLDFHVEDLESAVSHAIACGAKLSDFQYFENSRTMIDPEGHPFCLDMD